jgi:sensor domain CHASE-containing protein
MQRVRSPRKNTRRIFLITTLSIAVIISALSYYVILGSFVSLEEEQSRSDMAIILNTFTEQGQTLNMSAKTLGANDDSYQFLVTNSSGFINTTLANQKLEELQVNFVIIYNRTGDLYYYKGYDLVISQETIILDEVLQSIAETYSYLSLGNVTNGIICVHNTAIYIAASPITSKDQTGLSRGTLVVGRFIDSQYIEKLSEITNLPIYLGFTGDPHMTTDLKDAENYLNQTSLSTIFVQPLGTNIIASYTQIADITGNPSLILKTDRSRDIYLRGLGTVGFFITLIIVIVGIFVFLGLRVINDTFTQLEKNIEQFAILGDHIRNPLTVIIGLAGLDETEISRKIIEQAKIIDNIINKLDSGWIESEKIKTYLRKYSKK